MRSHPLPVAALQHIFASSHIPLCSKSRSFRNIVPSARLRPSGECYIFPTPIGRVVLSGRQGALAVLLALLATELAAHGGGLNAEGCHFNRKTGDYHCHRGAAAPAPSAQSPARLVPPTGQSAAAPQRTAPLPAVPNSAPLPATPKCYVGPRGGTYTITPSGRKNYAGC